MNADGSGLGRRTPASRFLLTGLAALAAALASSAVAAPAARADSWGCTFAPFGNVCLLIEGSGRYVSHVRVRRAKIDYGLICNYRGNMVVRGPRGRVIDRRRGPYHEGCSVLYAWYDWYPRRTYPHNSTICGAFWENGELQGRACNKVLR
jgi:hypothetical protein